MDAAVGLTAVPRTKLVCTIGPATAGRVHELVAAGMDVARVNCSHGTTASRGRAIEAVRAAAIGADRPVAVLADLSGPKIRLGPMVGDEARLMAGHGFTLRPGDPGPGTATGAGVTYRRLARDARVADRVFLADGAVELRVTAVDDHVRTEVVRGGLIRSHQGVSIPSDRLTTPPVTAKDRRDLRGVLEQGVDLVAQSFVRRAADIHALRELSGPDGPPIVAKIETRAAIEDFEAILEAADAVMIARGDLGVELPYEEVPIVQKQLVRRALDRGVPSIVATQMLESMIAAPRPTRAEASDVANAVFDGADAIMLSGETAIGRHPILAAEAAHRILRLCDGPGARHLPPGRAEPEPGDAGALAFAAVSLAGADPAIAAIACYTRSGRTARLLAALRPRVPILAYAPDPEVVAQLTLVHGVQPRTCVPPGDTAARLGLMAWLLGESQHLPPGAAVVLVASTAQPGTGPNLLELHRLPG
jgi:pyruvate kinase